MVDGQLLLPEDGWGERHGHAVVFVGIYGWVCIGFATFTFPIEDGIFCFADDVSQFLHLGDEGGYAVCFLDFQTLKSGKPERDVQQGTSHDEGLCLVGLVDEVVIHPCYRCSAFAEDDLPVPVHRFHAQLSEEFGYLGIALIALAEQTGQFDFGFFGTERRYEELYRLWRRKYHHERDFL